MTSDVPDWTSSTSPVTGVVTQGPDISGTVDVPTGSLSFMVVSDAQVYINLVGTPSGTTYWNSSPFASLVNSYGPFGIPPGLLTPGDTSLSWSLGSGTGTLTFVFYAELAPMWPGVWGEDGAANVSQAAVMGGSESPASTNSALVVALRPDTVSPPISGLQAKTVAGTAVAAGQYPALVDNVTGQIITIYGWAISLGAKAVGWSSIISNYGGVAAGVEVATLAGAETAQAGAWIPGGLAVPAGNNWVLQTPSGNPGEVDFVCTVYYTQQ